MSLTAANTDVASADYFGKKAGSTTSYQEAKPLPWCWGWQRLPVTLISPFYNLYTRPRDSHDNDWFHVDMLGAIAYGPLLTIEGFFNEDDWRYWYAHRATSPKYTDIVNTWGFPDTAGSIPDTDIGDWPIRFHWGEPDTALADCYLNGQLSDNHPPYRRIAFIEGKRLTLGVERGNMRNLEFVISRVPQLPASGPLSGLDTQIYVNGCNPVSIIAEIMTDANVGLGKNAARFGSTWQALSDELESADFAVSPLFDTQTDADQAIEEVLGYFDGFIYQRNGVYEIARFPQDGAAPAIGEVTTLSLNDLTEAPALQTSDPRELISELVVIGRRCYQSSDYSNKEIAVKVPAPFARRGAIQPKPEVVRVGGMVEDAQLQRYARIRQRNRCRIESKGWIHVRRPRAVNPDTSALRPGDRVLLTDPETQLTQLYRVTKRRLKYRSGVVDLYIVTERGQFPAPYIPPAEPIPDYSLPTPAPVAAARVMQAPWGLVDEANTLLVLAARDDQATNSVVVHLSLSGSSGPYDEIGIANTNALHATVVGNFTAAATTIRLQVDTDAFALDQLATQSSAQQTDDTLFLFAGDEALSIGTVTPLGSGQYDVTVLRARRYTLAAALANGDSVFVQRREFLNLLTHTAFAYDLSCHIKLQEANIFGITRSLASVSALAFTFPSAPAISSVALSLSGLTAKLSWDFPLVQSEVAIRWYWCGQLQASPMGMSVNTTTNTIESFPNNLINGDTFVFKTGTPPTPFQTDVYYTVINRTSTSWQLAAFNDTTAIDITASGASFGFVTLRLGGSIRELNYILKNYAWDTPFLGYIAAQVAIRSVNGWTLWSAVQWATYTGPAAVTSPSATVSGNDITLSWTATVDPLDIAEIEYYLAGDTTRRPNLRAAPDRTSMKLENLKPGTWWFRIWSIDRLGWYQQTVPSWFTCVVSAPAAPASFPGAESNWASPGLKGASRTLALGPNAIRAELWQTFGSGFVLGKIYSEFLVLPHPVTSVPTRTFGVHHESAATTVHIYAIDDAGNRSAAYVLW